MRTHPWIVAAIALLALSACEPNGNGPFPSNRAPVAAFETDYSGTNVTFDGRSSFDPDGDPLSYAWAFGDGAVGSGAVVSHRYVAPGSFSAQLTVSDGRGGTDVATTMLPVGRVSGDLEAVYGDASATISGEALVVPELRGTFEERGAAFVPGEVIVRFRDDVRVASFVATTPGDSIALVRELAVPGSALFRSSEVAASDAADDGTWRLVRALMDHPDVVDAHPNYVLQPTLAPNDPLYPLQWHYPAIGLEGAWDVTTGSPAVVVAVLDTGILYDPADPSRSHPDLTGKVVQGYDFVSPVTFANDGDGRDPDPYDPGSALGGQSTYHGTHVAGTIAARTNEGSGAAGVAWAARILPVRVLGEGGGLFSDVVDGLMWSAGFSVAGAPSNANVASVANLSLGGVTPCGSTFQAAIDAAVGAGTTVVVAAGNEGTSADSSLPANCANVIAVSATDRQDQRAWYANHGPRVAVMAPGGDMRSTASGGVYSLWRNDATGAFGHTYAEGTSQAAPHVAGVAALMLAVDPSLTPAEVRSLLRLTADPLSASACRAGDPSVPATACGAGLTNAAAAVASLAGPPPPPPPGELAFEPGSLDFGTTATTRPLRLRNVGGSALGWALVAIEQAGTNPAPVGAVIGASPGLGTIAAGGDQTITVSLDRSEAPAAGSYRLDLIFEEDGVERRVPVRFEVPGPSEPPPDRTTFVGTFTVGPDYEITVYGLTVYDDIPDDYSVVSMGGLVRVLAWVDVNGNATADTGDLVGEYPQAVSITGGGHATGVDLMLEPFVGTNEVVVRVVRIFSEVAAAPVGEALP